MRKTLLVVMFAAAGCAHAQVKPLGGEILDLERLRFDTKITDLYPDENINTFYTNGNVYNIPGENDGFFERKEVTNGHRIFEGDMQREVVVYEQIAPPVRPLARFKEHVFGIVTVLTASDGRIAAINASSCNTTAAQSAALVESLTGRYGEPVRLKHEWKRLDAPLYEWIAEDRIIRYVHAVNNSTVLEVDLDKMRISQGHENSYDSYLYIVDPELMETVFPNGKCTLFGRFAMINAREE